MKIFLLCLFVLIFSITCFAQDFFGEISDFVGKVEVLSSTQKTWKDARMFMKLKSNDKIRTLTESRAEIKCINGGIVRIEENSEIMLSERKDSKSSDNVSLFKGKVWANMKHIVATRREFNLKTPTATAAIRGTIFRVNSDVDSTTDVLVYEGKVSVGPQTSADKDGDTLKKNNSKQEVDGPTEIEGPTEVTLEDWVTIVAGMQITVNKDKSFNKEKFDIKKDAQDSWVKYNTQRDSITIK